MHVNYHQAKISMQLQQKPPRLAQSNQATKPKPKNNSQLWFLAMLAGFFFAVYWPKLHEEIKLRFYTAPANVILLANDTQMSTKGRRIFYLTQPQVNPRNADFCPNKSEKTIVLGCYAPAKDRISIQEVEDPRLDGIMQVTAAHEMLHAVYHRLSYTERKRVDQELAIVFSKLTDQRVKDNIALYQQQDPKVVPNELHSILATEVEVLTPFLENYYQQYFTDRSAVVKYAQQSAKPFAELMNEADTIQARLRVLKTEIHQLSAFNRGDRIDSAYSQKVDEYNRLIERYNALVDKGDALGESLKSGHKK
jgi:hypothetical protein